MPPRSVLRAAQNPFLESFSEAADRKSGAIRTQEQWDRFVRLLTARGLVLESEMLWLESVWIDQTRHATAFGHDRTASLRLEFADFERRLLRQFSDAGAAGEEKADEEAGTAGGDEGTAAEIERLIGQMSRQCAALDATVSDWKPTDEAAMDGSSLRKLLSYVEGVAGAHRGNLLGAESARADSERLLATQGAHNLVLQHVEAGHGDDSDSGSGSGSAVEWQLRNAGAVHRELQRRRIQRLSWVATVRAPTVGDHAADRFGHALGFAGGIALGRGKYGEKARPVELVVVPVGGGGGGGAAAAAQRHGGRSGGEREPVVLTARMKMPMTPQLLEQVWREFAVHRELALSPALPRCLGYADASTASSTPKGGGGGSDQLYFFYEFIDARSTAWLMERGAEKAAARHAYAAFDDDVNGLGVSGSDSGSGSGSGSGSEDEDWDEHEDERKVGVVSGAPKRKRKHRSRQAAAATTTAAAFRAATVLRENSSFFRRWSSDLLRALRDIAGQCTHRIEGRLTLSNAMVSANGRRTTLGRVRWGPAVLPADTDASRRAATVRGKSFTLPSYFDLREWQLMADYSAMVRAALGPYQPSGAGAGGGEAPSSDAAGAATSPSPPSSSSSSVAAPASVWPLKALPLAPPAVQMSFDECASLQRQAQAAGSGAPGEPRRKAGAVRLLTGQSLVVTLPADVNGSHSSWQAPVVLASPRAAQIVLASMRDEAGNRVSASAAASASGGGGGDHDAAQAGGATLTIEAVSAGWAEVSLFCRQPWAPPSSALAPTLRICVEVGEVRMSPELRGMLTCCDDAAGALREWRAVWDAATQHGRTATEADVSRCAAAAARTTELLTLRQLADHPYFRPAAAGDDDAVKEDFKRAFL